MLHFVAESIGYYVIGVHVSTELFSDHQPSKVVHPSER